MSKIVITHAVEDVARWKNFDDERVEVLGKYASDIESHIDVDGGNMVAVTMNVRDKEGLYALLKSSGDDHTHNRHGVIQPLTVMEADL